MRLFVLTRHAHSTLNAEGRVNGDPTVAVPLTDEGRAEAARLGRQLAQLPLELCVHTRFARTRETADAILAGRDVLRLEEPLLDDIDVGELEGETLDAYRAWKQVHTRDEPFPGGESLDDAARRYARAFARLLERPEQAVLVVCHEIPVRYAFNAAARSDDLDAPEHAITNAMPYLFDEAALARAAARIAALAGDPADG
ncbi:MAG: histidine phosphatase family protein [Gaiellaceae bacterium]